MDLPRGEVTSQKIDWSFHLRQAAEFKGSDSKYCRIYGLKKGQFTYHKSKLKVKQPKFSKLVVSEKKSFPQKSYPQRLPDPKWFSEVIHNLMKFQ